MKEVFPHIYLIEIPLKDSPLKWLNCYLLKGEGRGLLVDTGFNLDESERAVLDALSQVGLTPEQTDLFITHLHVDHAGLAERLKRPGNRVYASPQDAQAINAFQVQAYWKLLEKSNGYTGVPAQEALSCQEHVAHCYRPAGAVAFDLIQPGEHLQAAGMDFEVLDLKGHTPGQIGLYQKQAGILFCGDHILDRITPNIAAWDLEEDYLGYYLDRLQKVRALHVRHLYTAHRELPEDPDARIGFLLRHHAVRLQEVRGILAKEPWQNAYQVARQMSWSIKKGFPQFPKLQKWFACSEALAHLQHLWFLGEAQRRQEGPTPHYALK